jgi:hypothetical protein
MSFNVPLSAIFRSPLHLVSKLELLDDLSAGHPYRLQYALAFGRHGLEDRDDRSDPVHLPECLPGEYPAGRVCCIAARVETAPINTEIRKAGLKHDKTLKIVVESGLL